MSQDMAKYWTVNIVGFTLLILAHMQGWLLTALEADKSRIIYIILGLFIFGLASAWWKLSRLNPKFIENYENRIMKEEFQLRLMNKIEPIHTIENYLIRLGLTGTVVGFIIGFSGMGDVSLGDIDSAEKLLEQALVGVSVALYTTLAGLLGSIWLRAIFKILQGRAVSLWLGDN